MIVLDENVVDGQRELLGRKHVRARQIGFDVGRKGMLDSDILPFLIRQPRPTFFTQDHGFYNRGF